MPKIDPITGCSVMTEGEFWSNEAAREGKGRSGGDLREEFWNEIDAEAERVAAEWRKPEVALALLNGCEGFDDENEEPVIAEVLEVESSMFTQNIRSSSGQFVARVKTEAGDELRVRYSIWNTSGTRIDPPDGDEYWETVKED